MKQGSCLLGLAAGIVSLAGSSGLASDRPSPFLPGKLGFSLQYQEESSAYLVNSSFVLPGDSITLEAVSRRGSDRFVIDSAAGVLREHSARQWQWRSPTKTGLYPLQIRNTSSGELMTLNVFVMVPAKEIESGRLHGYTIGTYPARSRTQPPIYDPPRGFIEVTPENENAFLSPHFRLKQFLCKQSGGYPKYLVLRERLLLKLERILEIVNAKGYRCDSLHVMSGFRTPSYNQAIGNVRYSRHVWGGAADIFIDQRPRDGVMDDLNGDGRIDRRDAQVLYDIVDAEERLALHGFSGGLGRYRSTAAHGPFVHVDVRGFGARWGN